MFKKKSDELPDKKNLNFTDKRIYDLKKFGGKKEIKIYRERNDGIKKSYTLNKSKMERKDYHVKRGEGFRNLIKKINSEILEKTEIMFMILKRKEIK